VREKRCVLQCEGAPLQGLHSVFRLQRGVFA
jgi:hypothetical protein